MVGERFWRHVPRISVAFAAIAVYWSFSGTTARADSPGAPAYDISWPQCESGAPHTDFSFAIIGLNNGRPFTTNDCFEPQYVWAAQVQVNPAVYINLDFPKAGRPEAANGPYGRCAETDGWCRGYNWGWALAHDSVNRAMYFGVSPERYWLDVEMANHWSDLARDNGQVARGAIDYFIAHNIPVGLYGTRYQWNLITGGYTPPNVTLPLWVAGAEDIGEAHERCYNRSLAFAGGDTWMVQYPEGEFDGNVLCSIAPPVKRPVVAQPPQPVPPETFVAPSTTVIPERTPERKVTPWTAKSDATETISRSLNDWLRQAFDSRSP